MASPTTLTPPPELDQRLLEPRRHNWRGWLIALAVLLAIAVVAGLALDFVGMLPWRGPLSAGDARLDGVSATLEVRAGDHLIYPIPPLVNASRVGVVLDSVQPVDTTPGLHVEDAWLFVDTARCRRLAPNVPYGVPQACRSPMAGTRLPAKQDNAGSRVFVILKPTQPGTYRASGFDVHYHVGPIHYTTTVGGGYVIHAG